MNIVCLRKWIKLERGILYMGKASYRPKRNQNRNEMEKKRDIKDKMVDMPIQDEEGIEENEQVIPKITVVNNKRNQHKLDNVKIIGSLECEYHVYIEDYVYTYLYQLAAADLAKESSAILVGEIFSDSKEAIIRAAIPVDMDKLGEGAEWIDIGIAEEIEEQRKSYFASQDIIGWMHMQPGYGTMLTMKELREHQSVFEGNGTICMLIDAINKIETLFVYEEDELKEQSGYCMYYERNEEMQQFMLDHPFTSGTKEEMKDTVVNQFREIGKMRKAEYTQRKNLNLTVMAASIILIALTALIVKMNSSKDFIANTQDIEAAALGGDSYIADGNNTLLGEQAVSQVSNDATGIESNGTEKALIEDQNELASEGMIENKIASTDIESTQVAVSDEAHNEIANQTEEKANVEQKVEQVQTEKEYSLYTVQTGDTLADICYKEYGSAERSLEVAKFNGMSNTNELFVGQELKMPK